MRLTIDDRVATFRCTPELELRLNRLAAATGYTRSRVIRKMVDGALQRIEEDAETTRDLIIALNRFSRCK
jgi:predicted DNA-binding protein